jgi:transcriptional regulator with XRE-family HTH domain
MDLVSPIDKIDFQIKEAKQKRKKLILVAMDGRTQKSIAAKTGIDETKLSKWVNGIAELEEAELIELSRVTGVDFK